MRKLNMDILTSHVVNGVLQIMVIIQRTINTLESHVIDYIGVPVTCPKSGVSWVDSKLHPEMMRYDFDQLEMVCRVTDRLIESLSGKEYPE